MYNKYFQIHIYTRQNLKKQEFTASKGHYDPLNNMVDYTPWPVIVSYMKAMAPKTSEELHSQCISILTTYENLKFS